MAQQTLGAVRDGAAAPTGCRLHLLRSVVVDADVRAPGPGDLLDPACRAHVEHLPG